MAKIYINSLPYEVDEEVADQFSKFIRRANSRDYLIKKLTGVLHQAETEMHKNKLNTDFFNQFYKETTQG